MIESDWGTEAYFSSVFGSFDSDGDQAVTWTEAWAVLSSSD
jgi:hypothetical protein